uniref:Uncharacterized protein n=1 Tax=Anguilla anguilla TaxID=7936 RepID=A0A0E9UZH9_ANGAN
MGAISQSLILTNHCVLLGIVEPFDWFKQVND